MSAGLVGEDFSEPFRIGARRPRLSEIIVLCSLEHRPVITGIRGIERASGTACTRADEVASQVNTRSEQSTRAALNSEESIELGKALVVQKIEPGRATADVSTAAAAESCTVEQIELMTKFVHQRIIQIRIVQCHPTAYLLLESNTVDGGGEKNGSTPFTLSTDACVTRYRRSATTEGVIVGVVFENIELLAAARELGNCIGARVTESAKQWTLLSSAWCAVPELGSRKRCIVVVAGDTAESDGSGAGSRWKHCAKCRRSEGDEPKKILFHLRSLCLLDWHHLSNLRCKWLWKLLLVVIVMFVPVASSQLR